MTTTTSIGGAGPQTGVLTQRGSAFGDNPFLQLLTAQLKNQTPLEPVDNESFMNQMASYSSMQQQMDLNTNMLALLDYQGLLARAQGLSQGSALLGKEVTYNDGSGNDVKDIVASVFVTDDGEVQLRLQGGAEVPLRSVHAIANQEPPAAD